jgi:hypothetical protein
MHCYTLKGAILGWRRHFCGSLNLYRPGTALSREGACSGASNHAAANNGTCEYLRSNPPSLRRQLSTRSDPPAIPIVSLTV